MIFDEAEQDKDIREFLEKGDSSESALFEFFDYHVLHPDYEVEFTRKVARNVITIVHPHYLSLSRAKRFHLLKALAKLFEVSLAVKLWEFHLSRDDGVRFWSGLPLFFSALTGLIEPLETMRREIGRVSKRHLHQKILLVEGESEERFLLMLQFSTRLLNLDMPVYAYGGKGQVQNLIHFIKEKNKQGVLVYLSYDRDRQSQSFLKKIRKRCQVEKSFGFRRDFESSFPPRILAAALNLYSKRVAKLPAVLRKKDIETLLVDARPFAVAFRERYNVRLNKARLGALLGHLLVPQLRDRWNEIFNQRRQRKELQYEIYRFLRFIVRR